MAPKLQNSLVFPLRESEWIQKDLRVRPKASSGSDGGGEKNM